MTGNEDHEPTRDGQEESREERLARLLAEYMDRQNLGEPLDEERITRKHPDIASELLQNLKALQGPDPETPQVLGNFGDYELRRQIGRGGMGVVYEAWEKSIGRSVALKVLPAGISADPKAASRFVREAQAAGRLNHQNIVPIHAMGVYENTPYYSMDYIEGETLAEIVGKLRAVAAREDEEKERQTTLEALSQRLSRSDAATDGEALVKMIERSSPEEEADDEKSRWKGTDSSTSSTGMSSFGTSRQEMAYYGNIARAFSEVAEGLEHAHSKGVIHRDVKPSNLILDPEGRLRILDFGLARLEGEESLTLTGDFLGTPLYMSPEQAMSKRIRVDHRTDIYSLGATLYEMLAWRPPFQGKDRQDTLSQIIVRDPTPLRRRNPRIPRDLETIALKCLRKDPGDRYRTADALAQDLRRFANGEPIEARPQSRWEILSRRAWRYKLPIGVAAAFLSVVAILVATLFEQDPTTAMRRVWDVPSDVDVHAVAPDGRYLSYWAWDSEPGNAGLWIHDLASGRERRLTEANLPEHAGSSAFSPDGAEIAYSWQSREGVPELRVMAVGGSEPRVLYRGQELEAIEPHAWSQDGRRVLVAFHKKDTTVQIALVSRADGNASVIKSFDRAVVLKEALFSPDGQTIVYESRPDWYSSSSDLFLLSVGGTRETPIPGHPMDDSLLFWASDGLVYFARRDNLDDITMDLWCIPVADGQPVGQPSRLRGLSVADSEALRAMKPLGSAGDDSYYYGVSVGDYCLYTASFDLDAGTVTEPPQLVARGTSEPSPRWSPSGRHLAFLSQDRISILSVESGKRREFQPKLPPSQARFRDSGSLGRLCWLGWSPDERSLVVTGRNDSGALRHEVSFRVDVQSGETGFRPAVSKPQYTPDGTMVLGGRRPLKWEDVIDPGLWGTHIGRRRPNFLNFYGNELIFALSRRSLDPLAVCFALSPDGRLLAFTEYEEETTSWALNILPIDGEEPGTPRELFRAESVPGLVDPWNGYVADLSWTPDGSEVLFRIDRPKPGGYMRIPARGGDARKLDLKLKRVTCLRIHPDGRRVALAVDASRREIWALENLRSAVKPGGQDRDLDRLVARKGSTVVQGADPSREKVRWVGGTWAVQSGSYFVATYRDRERFVAGLKGKVRTVTFDDIETTDDQPASFASDRYRQKEGIVIRGMDGQFADRNFRQDALSPSSPPNMYASGPRGYVHADPDTGEKGSQTEVTFSADDRAGTVAGFGAVFIDADSRGPCSITVFDHKGEILGSESGFRGRDGSHLFRGIVVLNEEGNPVPAIAHVRMISGNQWPSLDAGGDGVALDDFTFGVPVPSQKEILLPGDALAHRKADVRWFSGIRAVKSGPYFLAVCRDRERFEACLKGNVRKVTFDDIETTDDQPTSFASDRYRRSQGIVIQGKDGQFADRSFRRPRNSSPSSSPNMYAPGPRGERHSDTGSQTEVTFSADDRAGTVAGFGAVFIDADWTGPCSLTVFDERGEILGKERGFRGGDASHLFRGIVVLNEEGDPVPVIARVRILSGDEWPSLHNDIGDGVPLDDFTFGVPVPMEKEISPPKKQDS